MCTKPLYIMLLKFKISVVFFFLLMAVHTQAISQIIKCNYCKGSGMQIEPMLCNNCSGWSDEYKRKVACHVCKDTRRIPAKGKCLICQGTGKVDIANPLGLNKPETSLKNLKKQPLGFYLQRALKFLVSEEYGKAIENCDYELSLYPGQDSVYVLRGMMYYKTAEIINAINDVKKAIKINPDNGNAYYLRGMILKDFNGFDKACDDFRKAVNLGSEPAKEMIEKYCN